MSSIYYKQLIFFKGLNIFLVPVNIGAFVFFQLLVPIKCKIMAFDPAVNSALLTADVADRRPCHEVPHHFHNPICQKL